MTDKVVRMYKDLTEEKQVTPSPVRMIKRDSKPEVASQQTIAVCMLRKNVAMFEPNGKSAIKQRLSALRFTSTKRALTDAEAEEAVSSIKRMKVIR